MNMPNRPPPPFFTTLPEQQRKEIYAEWVTWNETAREPLSLDAFAQMKSDPNAAAQNPRYPTSPGPPMSFVDFAISRKSEPPKEPPSAIPAQ